MASPQQARHSIGCHTYSWKEGTEFLIPEISPVSELGAHKDELIHTTFIARMGRKKVTFNARVFIMETIFYQIVFCTI